MDYVNWVVDHRAEVGAVVVAIHALAVTIVNLTPTPKDDEVLARVYRVVEVSAGLLTRLAKK